MQSASAAHARVARSWSIALSSAAHDAPAEAPALLEAEPALFAAETDVLGSLAAGDGGEEGLTEALPLARARSPAFEGA